MHAICLFMATVMSADLDVAVKMKSGTTVVGKARVERFAMQTDFGEASLQPVKLSSIRFGDPDTVITSGELRPTGQLTLDQLELQSQGKLQSLKRDLIDSITVIHLAPAQPGVITNGTAANGMTYYVRAPENFAADQTWPALVLLHGSNMSAKPYLETVVQRWPSLAQRHLLIGINGERRAPGGKPDDPRFNYTYVNFVGKSKYKGFPGTDRESPALLAEVVGELKQHLPFNRLFVAGHSQGGFLAYSFAMNYPELLNGVCAMSGGMIIQAEPTAFDDANLRAKQRLIPFAIVHGETDPNVSFNLARAAFDSLEDDGMPMLKLFSDPRAGHAFMALPLDKAVDWLQNLASNDPDQLMDFAEKQFAANEYRDAITALNRLRRLDGADSVKPRVDELTGKIAAATQPEVDRFTKLIAENKDGAWVDEFLTFRSRFGFADSAREVMAAYGTLRATHQAAADELFTAARKDIQEKRLAEGYAKYEQIVAKHYASRRYPAAKQSLAKRK